MLCEAPSIPELSGETVTECMAFKLAETEDSIIGADKSEV